MRLRKSRGEKGGEGDESHLDHQYKLCKRKAVKFDLSCDKQMFIRAGDNCVDRLIKANK